VKRTLIALLLVMSAWTIVLSQSRSDACHVYVVDVAKAKKTMENFRESGNLATDVKILSASQTVFPEFRPTIGEEELTTKTYRFPGSRQVITASVYYTDESMGSAEGNDSMLLGIVVSAKAQKDAITAENSAVSEITDNDNVDTVRAKKYLRVKGRLYLVGIECRCKERKSPR
jgi:hypothetical protein